MSLTSKIAFAAMGTAAGSLAAKALNSGWSHATGQEPPDPNDPEVPVVVALGWVVATGLIMAGAQLLVNRFAIRHWNTKVKPVNVRVSAGAA